MTNYTQTNIGSGYRSTASINAELSKVSVAVASKLDSDGGTLAGTLDMNSHRLINLQPASALNEPVTLAQLLSGASYAIGSVKYYPSVALWSADTTIQVNDVVIIATRDNATFDIISGTGTANTWDILAHDTLSLSAVIRETETLTFEQSGAIGGTDEGTLIASVFARAQGKKIKGKNGRTYISSIEQQFLPSCELDLGGATFNFVITGSTKGFIGATGYHLHNGTITVNVTSQSGSGETNACINNGDFQNGTGINNFNVHNLSVSTNKVDGGCINVFGGSHRGKISNITSPASATANHVIECHWGGQAASDAIQHPHDIEITNITSEGLTSATAGGAMVFLSSVYNIKLTNIESNGDFRGVVVSAGDFGDDYSIASQKNKIGKNITLDNVDVRDCFKTALQVNGYSQFGLTLDTVTGDAAAGSAVLTNVSSTAKLFVGRVIYLAGTQGTTFQIQGISGTSVTLDRVTGLNASGTSIQGGAWELSVTTNNCSFQCDNSATNVGPLSIGSTTGCVFNNTDFKGGRLSGVSFGDWAHNNTWNGGEISENQNSGFFENRTGRANGNVLNNVTLKRNNLAGGTDRTLGASVFLSSADGEVNSCKFGQKFNETAYYHVSIDNGALDSTISNSTFYAHATSGACFKNAHGGVENWEERTLAYGNTVKAGLTIHGTNSTPMLSSKVTNITAGRDNVEVTAAAQPTSGSWVIGDFVKATARTVDGNSMMLHGWLRRTTSSNNANPADWEEHYISVVSPGT